MLEIEKMKLEKMKVECGKAEMLVRIMEFEQNITRLRSNIEVQDKRINELTEKLEKEV